MRKKEQIVKRVSELSKEELEQIVESIQGWLWVGDPPADVAKSLKNCEVWNPDNTIDCPVLYKNVRDIMTGYGLKPTKIIKFEG